MAKCDLPGSSGPFGFERAAHAGAYSVELLYSNSPRLDAESLAGRVKAFCPKADVADAGGRAPVLFSHRDHLVPIEGVTPLTLDAKSSVPARTVVMPTDRVVDVSTLHESLLQTRDWDNAVEALARSTSRVVVTDLLAKDLNPSERLALFERVLLGVIEACRPLAIHWKPAGKLVDPAALLKASGSASADALPSTALNVRLFRIKHSDEDLLMDTLGLAALGLPDLQVIFHRMEPARVAAHLYAVALYILRNGDAVEEGETIEGPSRGQEWVARRSRAVVEPPRPVVDFDPGPDFSVRAA